MHFGQVVKNSTRGLYFWIIKRTRPSPGSGDTLTIACVFQDLQP
jgi:hypothetical protein